MNHHTDLNDWYRRCFRRLLIDIHIPDWDSQFLSNLNAEDYVKTVSDANVTSAMVYSNSHVGHALYPSEIGSVHGALKGTDFVGDVLRGFHQNNVAVVAYYSAIFNNEIFLKHPDWRMVPKLGETVYQQSRYGVCCPNSPYRDFAVAQTEEICRRYAFDGIFFDMLFWPYICYCPHCQSRFENEEGCAIPEIIDWNHPTWMAFQRARERWMAEMAGLLTSAVRRTRASMTVTHQMSPVLHDWRLGMPFSITDHCDYTSGDFYGPAIQQSMVCKLFAAISSRKPFEFHTSRCVDLHDHVTMKSDVRMETQASLAPAHASAFLFIDAINPDGSLNKGVYDKMGAIFNKLTHYEKFLGGDLVAEVAIYFSDESRFDFRESGLDVKEYSGRADNMASRFAVPHMDAVKGAARALQESHIPYAVITRRNLDRLKDFRVVLLPNVLVMSDEEVAALREYVAQGGAVYGSAYSSAVESTGLERADFGLADVFGISKQSGMEHRLSFIKPVSSDLCDLIAPQEHVILKGGTFSIEATSARVLAESTAAWYPEDEGSVFKPSFASIHSTPPAPTSTGPAIVTHTYGKGQSCYAVGAIEAEDFDISRRVVAHLIRRLLGAPPKFEALAPRFIELTVFEKTAENRINISLVTLQEDEDTPPASGSVKIRFDSTRKPTAIHLLPDRTPVTWKADQDGLVEFEFSNFHLFQMFEVDYTATV